MLRILLIIVAVDVGFNVEAYAQAWGLMAWNGVAVALDDRETSYEQANWRQPSRPRRDHATGAPRQFITRGLR